MSAKYEIGLSKTENEIEINQLPIKGKVPDWLNGMLLRNGPGTFNVGDEVYRHWFDGLAMLHKFSFENGNVGYANKFLKCKAFNEARETGKISYSEFATDPCRSMFERVTAVFNQKITDSAKVNIAEIAEKFVALGETSMQIEFDPKTLDSLGIFQYEPKYKQHITTVHPHFDSSENAAYNLVTRFNRISHYRMLRLKGNGQREVVGEIPVKEPAYLHSFGMSPKYLIIAEFPLVVNPLKLLFQIKPFIENFKWKPKQGTRFYIMDRQTGELRSTVETDAFFAFHHLNAFELGDELVVDINAYDDADVINAFYLNRLIGGIDEIPFGRLKRYRIDLNQHTVKQELLSEANIELARFDYDALNMNENYTHVYGVSISEQKRQGFYNQIVKINVKDGKWLNWFEEGSYPGEPVFVAAPDRKEEDEGVVLSVVLDTKQGKSFLLVLDANSFAEIARAEVPQPILFGYHGAYFD